MVTAEEKTSQSVSLFYSSKTYGCNGRLYYMDDGGRLFLQSAATFSVFTPVANYTCTACSARVCEHEQFA